MSRSKILDMLQYNMMEFGGFVRLTTLMLKEKKFWSTFYIQMAPFAHLSIQSYTLSTADDVNASAALHPHLRL